jgi:hypothetical protein
MAWYIDNFRYTYKWITQNCAILCIQHYYIYLSIHPSIYLSIYLSTYLSIYLINMYRAHTHGLIDPLQKDNKVLQGFAPALPPAWRGVSSILCVPPWYRWRAAGHVVDWRQCGEIWDQCWGPQSSLRVFLVKMLEAINNRNPASPESIPADFGRNQRLMDLKPFTDLWTEWTWF